MPNNEFFNPPIEPIISSGEIRAYTAMIEGHLMPSATKISVVVIGAGLAGLAAARELKKSGVQVTILEGSDRAGGRCHTLASSKFEDGLFAEAGGMRIPDSHKLIMKYIDYFELSMMSFGNMKDKSGLLFFDGNRDKVEEKFGDSTSVLARVAQKWDES